MCACCLSKRSQWENLNWNRIELLLRLLRSKVPEFIKMMSDHFLWGTTQPGNPTQPDPVAALFVCLTNLISLELQPGQLDWTPPPPIPLNHLWPSSSPSTPPPPSFSPTIESTDCSGPPRSLQADVTLPLLQRHLLLEQLRTADKSWRRWRILSPSTAWFSSAAFLRLRMTERKKARWKKQKKKNLCRCV